MGEKSFIIHCPFCGAEMIWNSDYTASEVGLSEFGGEEDKIVKFYTCSECECSGEFVES